MGRAGGAAMSGQAEHGRAEADRVATRAMSGGLHDLPLVARCEACRKPVADDEGYLWVADADVAAFRREIPGVPEHELPDFAPWWLHHRACDPTPGASAHRIDIGEVATLGDLMDKTAHLMEDGEWITYTTWGRLLADVVGGVEGCLLAGRPDGAKGTSE